jgi:hypothetical protein
MRARCTHDTMANTVAILAQGTHWADALAQAFLHRCRSSTCSQRVRSHPHPHLAPHSAHVPRNLPCPHASTITPHAHAMLHPTLAPTPSNRRRSHTRSHPYSWPHPHCGAQPRKHAPLRKPAAACTLGRWRAGEPARKHAATRGRTHKCEHRTPLPCWGARKRGGSGGLGAESNSNLAAPRTPAPQDLRTPAVRHAGVLGSWGSWGPKS